MVRCVPRLSLLRPERRDKHEGIAALLQTRHFPNHGGNHGGLRDQIAFDVFDDVGRGHPCRGTTICHCRTGVAIIGLVSREEDQAPFLQRLNARVVIDTLRIIRVSAGIGAKLTRPKQVPDCRGVGLWIDHVVFFPQPIFVPDTIIVREQVGRSVSGDHDVQVRWGDFIGELEGIEPVFGL